MLKRIVTIHKQTIFFAALLACVSFIVIFATVSAWEQFHLYNTNDGGGGRGLFYNNAIGYVYVIGGFAPFNASPVRGQLHTFRYDANTGSLSGGWPKVWNTGTNDMGLGITKDNFGNFYVIGISCPVDGTVAPSLRTISYDSAGIPRWNRTEQVDTWGCGAHLPYFSSDIVIDPSGSYVFISTNMHNGGPFKIFKYATSNGTPAGSPWPVEYNTPASLCFSGLPCNVDEGHGIGIDPSGTYLYVTGRAGAVNIGGSWRDHLRTVKFSAANGSVQSGWPQISGQSAATELGVDVVADASYIYVAANTTPNGVSLACAIYKYSQSGILQQGWPIATSGSFQCTSMRFMDGEIYLGGFRQGSSPLYAYVIRKYSTDGTFVREYGPLIKSISESGIAYAFDVDATGNLFVTGQVDGSSPTIGSLNRDMLTLGAYWTVKVDGTPPSSPSLSVVLGSGDASCNTANLSWTASADPESGISGYRIYRNGSNIATVPSSQTTYSNNSGLNASTNYSYYVEAVNGSGLTTASNASSVTTTACPDTTPPGVPTGVSATRASCTQINVSWSAASDNPGGTGVQGYNVYRNGTKITASPVAGTSYADINLPPNTAYSYQITAVDKANNESARSIASSATTQCSPSADIKANGSDGPVMIEHNTSAVLSWCGSPATVCANASSCSVAPGGWSGILRTQSTGNLTASQTYTLSCTGLGGVMQDSVTINVSAGGDTTQPSTPAITSVSNSTCSQLRIVWTASTDNVAVAGYNIYRNGSAAPLNSSLIAGTSYTDGAVTPGVSYSYRVRAVDTSNNVSSLSNAVSGTPTQCPDTSPPAPPPDVTLSLGAGAEARCNSINVFWTQSNDPESGIARYDLWRRVGGVGAFGLHRTFLPGSGEFNSRTFVDTSLGESALHEYIVRAVNGVGLWTDSSLEGLETAACPSPVGTDKFDLSANPILLTATVIGGSSALATSSATFITVTPQPGLPAGAQVVLMLDTTASHAVAQTLTPRFIKSGAITSEITLTFANPTAPQSVVFRLAVPHNTALGMYEPMVIRAKDTDKTTNIKLRTESGGTGER